MTAEQTRAALRASTEAQARVKRENAAHTPGPWTHVYEDDAVDTDTMHGVQGPQKLWIATTYKSGTTPLDLNSPEAEAEVAANARLIAAAPDLLAAQTMGVEINTPDFLDWIAARLVKVHGENPHVDYVLSLRERAKAGRAAIAKTTGEPT